MNITDLEHRVEELERKAIWWDVTSFVIGVIMGVGVVSLLGRLINWIF
jgi:hypothetical protein